MQTFHPSPRILLGPGPSDVLPRTLQALAKPTLGHLDPEFIILMDNIQENLREIFLTKNKATFPISAPASAAMEACLINLIEPLDKVIVCINGVFGHRMKSIVERAGATPIILECEWGRAVDPKKFEDLLKKNGKIKAAAFVHGETSTGALSDIESLSKICKEYGCLSIVDAVTSLAGVPVRVDEWGIDAIYSGAQKCLSAPPGLSLVSLGDHAVSIIKSRKQPVQSWFLDFNLIFNYWNEGEKKRVYHHTAPVNALYGLHESLLVLKEEGLENSWTKHQLMHQELKQGLMKLDFKFLVPENERLPQLNAVVVPHGIDEAQLRAELLSRFQVEIGAGLGPLAGKILRIGLMGASANKRNIAILCSGLKDILKR